MTLDLDELERLCEAVDKSSAPWRNREHVAEYKRNLCAMEIAARLALPELVAIAKHVRETLAADGFETIRDVFEELRLARKLAKKLKRENEQLGWALDHAGICHECGRPNEGTGPGDCDCGKYGMGT